MQNLLGGTNTTIGQRGEVFDVDDTALGIEVRTEDFGHLRFMKEELEFEETFKVLPASSADPALSDDVKVVSRHDDGVNHPSHYADGWSNGAEVIDITEHLNFNRGNAVKYLARAGKKGGPEKELEDLQKALWYVTREVLRLGGTVG
ncbi:DUF3310 domain-containing protein [Streptomyces sp. WG5]|uniref:DUF3310 domain-containing protein n=1 Tax=Streptomyces sp. WG5 TaxID=3417648 RepID=UPI003CECC95E